MKRAGLGLLCLLLCLALRAQDRPFVTSDGVPLYHKMEGRGLPCLYIHGGPGSGSYWLEKFSGELLEDRFQMIYIDLRGVGRSGSPADGNYSLDRMLQDIEELRRHYGIDRWLVMGHSFSGTMLTAYAARYPQVLEGLLMFNCTLDLGESIRGSWVPRACELLGDTGQPWCQTDSFPSPAQFQTLFSRLQERDLGWQLSYREQRNEKTMNATFAEIPDWNHAFSGIGIYHPDYRRNFKPLTAAIGVPVLFFTGANDWTVGPRHIEGVDFPHLLHWQSPGSHIPFLEEPEQVAQAIDAFLAFRNNLGY